MIILNKISKQYENKNGSILVVNNISLKIKNGKFTAFVGPSGCGKTTFLKIVAGLIKQSSGKITVNGKEVISANKERGIVFQNFSLFPWLTVEGNILFGLNLQSISRKIKKKVLIKYLMLTELIAFKHHYPKQLSGGMQQRVAIARTLANDPKMLLLDEPFGALDTHTRLKMQEFLLVLWQSLKKSVIFVTHDIEEAIFLADTVCVLSSRPMEIKKIHIVPFSYPRTNNIKYSAKFIKLKKKISKEIG